MPSTKKLGEMCLLPTQAHIPPPQSPSHGGCQLRACLRIDCNKGDLEHMLIKSGHLNGKDIGEQRQPLVGPYLPLEDRTALARSLARAPEH